MTGFQLSPILAAEASKHYDSIDDMTTKGSGKGTPSYGFYQVGSNLVTFANTLGKIIIAFLVLALVITGIQLIFGGEETKIKIRRVFPWLLGATGLVTLTFSIASVILKATGRG